MRAGRLLCSFALWPWCQSCLPRKVSSLWLAVGLIALAVAAHQGWSANMFTIATDMFPSSAVGTVVGLGGMLGAVGGLLFAKLTGYVLQWTDSYMAIFIVAGFADLAALAIIHMLVPNLEPANFEATEPG